MLAATGATTHESTIAQPRTEPCLGLHGFAALLRPCLVSLVQFAGRGFYIRGNDAAFGYELTEHIHIGSVATCRNQYILRRL